VEASRCCCRAVVVDVVVVAAVAARWTFGEKLEAEEREEVEVEVSGDEELEDEEPMDEGLVCFFLLVPLLLLLVAFCFGLVLDLSWCFDSCVSVGGRDG